MGITLEERERLHTYIVNKFDTMNRSSRGGNKIRGVILHFTAAGDIDGVVDWFENPAARASAHDVISRSGKIVHMVPDEYAAWHAGARTGVPTLNGMANLNATTYGIEICNWGPLYLAEKYTEIEVPVYKYVSGTLTKTGNRVAARQPGRFYTLLHRLTNEYNGPYPVEHLWMTSVLADRDKDYPGGNIVKFWEPYPNVQVDVVVLRLRDIVDRYPEVTRKWIGRHQDTDPTAKLDPGPAFPYEEVLGRVFPTVVGVGDVDPQFLVSDKDEVCYASLGDMLGHFGVDRGD